MKISMTIRPENHANLSDDELVLVVCSGADSEPLANGTHHTVRAFVGFKGMHHGFVDAFAAIGPAPTGSDPTGVALGKSLARQLRLLANAVEEATPLMVDAIAKVMPGEVL